MDKRILQRNEGIYVSLITFLELFLSFCTLGTIIPTLLLGGKINASYRGTFIASTGFLVGVMFSIADTLARFGLSLWGLNTWIPALINLLILYFLIRCHRLSLIKALIINFVMQCLFISALPMNNNMFREVHLGSQLLTYFVLAACFTFVFSVGYRLMPGVNARASYVGSGIYIYIVLLALVAFKPVTHIPEYRELIALVAGYCGLLPLGLSLFIHLFLIPFISLIPYNIAKKNL